MSILNKVKEVVENPALLAGVKTIAVPVLKTVGSVVVTGVCVAGVEIIKTAAVNFYNQKAPIGFKK